MKDTTLALSIKSPLLSNLYLLASHEKFALTSVIFEVYTYATCLVVVAIITLACFVVLVHRELNLHILGEKMLSSSSSFFLFV